jgi:sec-independent protein translocase protein TatB
MLDIAWPELIVIGAVALVAIGPKDLPKVMHAAGRWAGKARALAREIQSSIDQLSYEAEIADKLKRTPHDEQFAETPAPPPPAASPSPAAEAERE